MKLLPCLLAALWLAITLPGCSSSPEKTTTAATDDDVATDDDDAAEADDTEEATGPVEATVADGKPQGLFFMTRFWPSSGSLEKIVWYFAPDGQVYQNLTTGFSAADLGAHQGPKGTYQVRGDQLTVTWDDGSVSQSTVEVSGRGFHWNAGIFTPIRPFTAADRRKLAGRYEGGESFSTGRGGGSVSKTLELRPDGTFAQSGTAAVRSISEGSAATAGGESVSDGRWQLDEYALTLTSASGQTTRAIAFPYDDEKTPAYPDHFFFNGTMYKRL